MTTVRAEFLDIGAKGSYAARDLHIGSGARELTPKDVRPYHVNVGIPAKVVRVKPNAPPDGNECLPMAKQRSRADGD